MRRFAAARICAQSREQRRRYSLIRRHGLASTASGVGLVFHDPQASLRLSYRSYSVAEANAPGMRRFHLAALSNDCLSDLNPDAETGSALAS
jgi:hypothetical protein